MSVPAARSQSSGIETQTTDSNHLKKPAQIKSSVTHESALNTTTHSLRSATTQSQSPYRNLDMIAKQNLYRVPGNRSVDRFSVSSKKSVVSRLKEKMFGKKQKSNILDEQLIKISMRIVDTTTSQTYTLEEAIKNNLTVDEDRILVSTVGTFLINNHNLELK